MFVYFKMIFLIFYSLPMRPHSLNIPVKLSARIFVRTVIICTVVMYGKEGTNICPTFDRRLTLLLFR